MSIKLTKKQPHKTYSATIESEENISELCKFLKNHKDKVLGVTINGKHVKFDSVAGRKKFAAGFQLSAKVIGKRTEELCHEMQDEINELVENLNDLKLQIKKERDKNIEYHNRLVATDTVLRISKEAWEDTINEYKSNCDILQTKLNKYELRTK